jgi:hypothetical protein
MNDEHTPKDPPTPRSGEPTDGLGVMDPPRQQPSDVMPDHQPADRATDVMAPPVDQPETD